MYLIHFKYRLFDEILHKFGYEVSATLEGFGHERFSSISLRASCDDLHYLIYMSVDTDKVR